ncbi:hypothetical protein IVB16_08105 [Bradyrhizobium sp. 183]|uniref:hypothetical protein n=1 Tax=unclassified Bradyrhizobium TaxID=2631580 RepID=UPI0020000F10|nr:MULTISPECIES: hypothetical protein [unclassified Bradyrhizobium]UPJ81918.1 hypothetical protein IVB17_08105 [Bradyrhizobium sp. 184]UPJ89712.1 hypothetical protein IVB16_08105 [Bradyrhizobium sp. 183]
MAVEEQSGMPFDVIVAKSSRTQPSLHNWDASRKFLASKANVALPSTSIANTTPKKAIIDTHFHQHRTTDRVASVLLRFTFAHELAAFREASSYCNQPLLGRKQRPLAA